MKAILLSLMLISCFSYAQNNDAAKRKKQYNVTSNSLAVDGYDVVSYFASNPKKGNQKFATTFNGIIYYFSWQTNLDLFKKTPEKYEPAYGGWCAYAMGNTGEKVEVDPETYKIVDGKLYLFYNVFFTNTLPKWNKDDKNLKTKADKNWLTFLK